MTPELWDIWWGKVRTSLPKRVANVLSVHDWRDAGLVMETEIVRAAVAAQKERDAGIAEQSAANFQYMNGSDTARTKTAKEIANAIRGQDAKQEGE